MKKIELLTFRHFGALAQNAETMQVMLKPMTEMTLVIKRIGLDPAIVESTGLFSVHMTPDNLREMAEQMVFAAEELDKKINPLCATGCGCEPPDLGTPPKK